MKKILFLAANPIDTSRLRLDEEMRNIDEGLRRSQHRQAFELVQKWAVRPRDIQRALLNESPNIIHFLGAGDSVRQARRATSETQNHYSSEETSTNNWHLILEDNLGNSKPIEPTALANLFQLFVDQVECVVLNACYSEAQAKAIAEFVPYVVGTNEAIGDRAATEFAVAFYDALGAGRPIDFAFKLGQSSISLSGISDSDVAILHGNFLPKSKVSLETSLDVSDDVSSRLRLYKLLLNLPNTQFEQLMFALNPGAGNVPSSFAPQGDRVSALLAWAESPVGSGIKILSQALEAILEPTKATKEKIRKYDDSLKEYERLVTESLREEFQNTSTGALARNKLENIRTSLGITLDDAEAIEASIENTIIIQSTLQEERVYNYTRLARAIFRYLSISLTTPLKSTYLPGDSIWEISLPAIGLQLPTQDALFYIIEDGDRDLELVKKEIDNFSVGRAEYLQLFVLIKEGNKRFNHNLAENQITINPLLLSEMLNRPENTLTWMAQAIFRQTNNIQLPRMLPYATEGPTRVLFFGRENELSRIANGYQKGGIVIGAHRSGKTSFLEKLKAKLEGDKECVVVGPTTVINFKSFFKEVLEKLKIPFSSSDLTDLRECLNVWSLGIKSLKEKNSRLVFLLDEVDMMLGLDSKSDFSVGHAMRALQNERYCEFFLAGHAKLHEAIELEASPYKNFSTVMILTGLTYDAAKELIQNPMKLLGFEIMDSQAERIYHGTAGVAVLLQEFCLALLDEIHVNDSDRVTEDLIQDIEESPKFLDKVFDHYKYKQTWISMAITAILAIEGQGSRSEINRTFENFGITLSYDALDSNLNFLTEFGVIKKQKGGIYRILAKYLEKAIKERDPEAFLRSRIEIGLNQ